MDYNHSQDLMSIFGSHLHIAHLIFAVIDHGLAVYCLLFGAQLFCIDLADFQLHFVELFLLGGHSWLEEFLQSIQFSASLTLQYLIGCLQLGSLCPRYLLESLKIALIGLHSRTQIVFHILR